MSGGPGCFLIGCGPSLNRTDVRRLADFDTITFNRAYVAWHEWAFTPTYYACFDPIALDDNVDEINGLIDTSSVRRFFLSDAGRDMGFRQSDRIAWVTLVDGGHFSVDPRALGDFGNVGASSLQILAALGYRRVAMVGVDARYEDISPEGGIDRPRGDRDHFHPDYYGGRRRNSRPDLNKVLGRWPDVAEASTRAGMDVRNATPGSALDCFDEVDYQDALAWVGRPDDPSEAGIDGPEVLARPGAR